MSSIEALYIFDEHNHIVLEHVYTGRPPAASTILSQYLAHAQPRPSLVHLPSTNPPTLAHSILHDRLLYICCTSHDVEPLLVLEFLHRVTDALEDFLGSPLLASKIEAQYDVVAQIVGEMCDAGLVCNTEPNALKEVIDTTTWMDNWLGGLGLPGAPQTLASRVSTPNLSNSRPSSSFPSSTNSTPTSAAGSAIPWRRSNVRHTSNELYVDIVEKLSVVFAPSGRPLSAMANGTIAFTAKISGVPDLLLTLTAPGGKTGITQAMDLPCFHPCVRLARWRDTPGELSFVPPDGRFVLAGYECNLLPDIFTSPSTPGKISTPTLNLPVNVEVRPSLGNNGDEFEARLLLNPKATTSSGSKSGSGPITALGSRPGAGIGGRGNAFNNPSGSSASPAVEDVLVSIPVPTSVRNISDLRASKGEAHYLATESTVEWRISNKEIAAMGSLSATLRCTIVGPVEQREDDGTSQALTLKTDTFDYDDTVPNSYQSASNNASTQRPVEISAARDQRRVQQHATLMPRSASLSFSVRGWLASGIKVEGLVVNTKTSKGLGAGVTPYKGVKYHTVSRRGVEVRV